MEATASDNPRPILHGVAHTEAFRDEVFQSLFDILDGYAIFMLAPDGAILSWNTEAASIFGYTEQEITGRPYSTLYTPDNDREERMSADLERSLREGCCDTEVWRMRSNGTRFRARVSLTPLRDTDDRLQAYLGVTRDLTRRDYAEERFRLLVNSVQDYAIFMLDPSGRIMSWNTGAVRLKGWTAEEIIGRHFSTFYTQADIDSGHPAQELNIAANTGRYEEEGWRLRKNGERFWANVVITRLNDADGKLIGFSKVTRDLTERRRNEQALRESEERFRLMVESVKDYAIIMLDPEGHIISWNAGAERIKGWRAGEIIGRHFSLFYPPEDVKSGKMGYELKTAEREGRFEDHGWRVRKDGSCFWANVVITALRDERGKLRGFSKVTRDISEQKAAGDSLRRAHEELERRVRERTQLLEAANQELESFSYSVSHDLRAPLRSMDGFSAALLKSYGEKLDERARDYLWRIRGSSQRMAQLIDDLLNLSRLGRQQMRKEPVDLTALAGMVADELRRAEPKRSVEFTAQPGLEGYGDPNLLKIVLENLLGNAWKYTGRRERARIEFGGSIQKNRTVYFVRDNGAGFDMAFADRLFAAFQRLHSPNEFPGTGIGLATVKRIIQRHGGDIWGQSEPEAGATFFFTLDSGGPQ
ncbi:MAG TPA: PAS domain S-box protein [Gammaproteobacteria bacterium]|nr:PAS domain S-box protein [Gammaproteobacteria bacterium]